MNGWQRRKLTGGSGDGRFHAHSYYDIPVFDEASRRLALYRMAVAGAHPGPDDIVDVGWVDVEDSVAAWHAAGTSRAWSVQQGPMAQWIPGGSEIVWNDRDGERFVARVRDIGTNALRTLPRPDLCCLARWVPGVVAEHGAARPAAAWVRLSWRCGRTFG